MSEKHYKQLKSKDRELIEEMLNAKRSLSAIAKAIGCTTGTVSREIVRNRRDDGYGATPCHGRTPTAASIGSTVR